MKKIFQQQKGFGLVEIIICLAIISITFYAFLELTRYNLIIQEQSKAKTEAVDLASEAIEAVRGIRNENWDNLASLSLNTEYYPIISENKWTLALSDPGLINSTYKRWVILEMAYRDINDNISSSGIEDNQTKKVTVVVEWDERGQTKQIDLTTYLTNWNN